MKIPNIDTPEDNFTSIKLSSNGFDGKIKDILILPERAKQAGGFLTDGEQSVLMFRLSKLMLNARIDRPVAVYDDPVSAKTPVRALAIP